MNLILIRDWITFICELYICWILTHEFYYDKKIYEQKRRKVKRTKDKVLIEVDKDGNAQIIEQPKNVEVTVSHKEG